MKKRVFFGLLALNFSLFAANVLVSPRGAMANAPSPEGDGFGCCKAGSFGGIPFTYCCEECCFIEPNCGDGSGSCGVE